MMPPRRGATFEDAAITGSDRRSRQGFHPDLLLSRRNTLASLNIQDIQTGAELVAAQTSSVDHQTTLVESQHNS
jgi:hypothetical protein